MIQGIRNNLATYPHLFSKASSAGSGGGSTVSVRRIEKFENRLDQTEQSNRALLDELMRIQTDMKLTSQRHQQRLDEEKQARQQLDNTLRSVLGRLAEAEERARRAELTTAETKAALTQLVTHTKNVERAIGNSQQGLASRKDANSQRLDEFHKEIGQFSRTREQLEKNTQNLRNEMQELKEQYLNNSLSKQNSGGHMIELQNTVQELQSKLKVEEASRELLQQQVSKRNVNDIENKLNKNNEDVLQRMTNMEKTVYGMEELTKKTTTEMEKILAAEIQARRDQGKLLKSKIYECNDNLRAGLATIQGKKLPGGGVNDVNWKLDAVKVHQISEEAADQVRQDLEKQIKELQKKQKTLEDSANKVPEKTGSQRPTEKQVKKPPGLPEAENNSKNTFQGPAIAGGQLDQNLDQILFTQEKLKWQINQLQEELNRLTGQQSGSLEDRFALMERRLTARMDAESRNTNKNVILLKDDIDLLKKNAIQMEGRGNPEVRRPPSNGENTEWKLSEKLDKDLKTKPLIAGSEADQRLDQITFAQEKLRNQNAQMQEDINKLMIGSKPGSVDDRLADLDRKVTARMDAETRNRNKDVQLLKDDIEWLKKRDTTLAEKQHNTTAEDVKILKKEMADTKTGFRKLAESVQVVKTTLGDKLTAETKIRKQETGRLQTDMSKIKTWMQKNQ